MTPSTIAADVSAAAPRTLRHLVGQPNVVATLEIATRAYWNDHASGRSPSAGPFSFSGPSGTGKTLAARILAAELGLADFKEALGQTFATPTDLHRWLLDSGANTALFIDECATMNPAIQHELLIAVDENRIMLPAAGPGRKSARIIPLEHPAFIFATTNPEDLLPALRSRMRVECHFDFYEVEALTIIIKQRADACHWRYESEDILRDIAARSRETPRLAMRILTAVWRVARSEDAEVMTRAHLEVALRLERIDAIGLDIWQRRYLLLLAEDGAGVEIRLGTIASTFGLPTKTIAHVVEPYLLRQRLISKTEKGRAITERGLRHLRGEPLVGNSIDEES